MSHIMTPAPEPKTELGRYRVLSSLAGVRCSPLQLGAMSIGDAWSEIMGSMSKEDSFKLLDAYYDAGGNTIDTANNYQDEQSETWIGEWMQKRQNRNHMIIATKYTTAYRSYTEGKGISINSSGNSKRSLHISVNDSLKKLQTDFIDILYLHWWDWTTSIPEVMDSLHALVMAGKVLYLGISDTPAWIISAANEYAKAHGKTPFCVVQAKYNLSSRDLERDIIPMARHYGMAIAPWSAMGGGRFQSKKAMEERKARGEGIRTMMGGPDLSEDEVRISEALCKVGAEHGIDSPTTIALAYVMAKTPDVFPIIGGRKVEHLMENIKALSIVLTLEQIKTLEDASPFDIGFPMNFIGDHNEVTHRPGFLLAAAGPIAFAQARKPVQMKTSQ